MHSLPTGSSFTDIYGLKFYVQFLHWGSSIFWDFTQCVLLVGYRCFGTTYRSHLQASGRTALVRMIVLRCVRPEKIANLTSWLITHFQQSHFFSWWKISTS